MFKEKIKKIPFLGRKVVSAWSWYLRFQESKTLRLNEKFKNAFAGRKCFIIATGPSIKRQDLKKLKGQLSISVSNFYVHPDFAEIKPEFHLFAAMHPPITEDQYSAMLKDAEKHFPHGQKILMSIGDKHIVEKFNALKKQNVYYYSLGLKNIKPKSTIDFSKQLPTIQTSPHIAIYLAIYLGAKEINLLGCDHDWILHFGETRHFYDEKKSVLSQKGYDEWRGSDFGTECAAYASLWEKYRRMRAYASAHGITVINCTDGGLLDVFPRKNLEAALETKQSP